MSTETKPLPAAALQPSPELVNVLLKWPEELRLDLAGLLLDSVKEGFGSLEEVAQRDRDMIRHRLGQVVRGEIETMDWQIGLARVEEKFRSEPDHVLPSLDKTITKE